MDPNVVTAVTAAVSRPLRLLLDRYTCAPSARPTDRLLGAGVRKVRHRPTDLSPECATGVGDSVKVLGAASVRVCLRTGRYNQEQ